MTIDDTRGTRTDRLLAALLELLINEVRTMANEMANLTAAVARNTAVTASALALIAGIKAQLDAAIAAEDPAALQALSDSLGKDDDALAAAVAANTPAAPPAA